MINFRDQLNRLRDLQKLDGQIFALRRELATHPEKIKQLADKVKAEQAHLNSLNEDLKKIQLERKNKEMELTGKEENVKKYLSQQLQVKSNKEYAALQHEIDTLKADNSMLEEEVLRLLDDVDRVTGEVNKEKALCSEREKEIKDQEAQFRGEAEKLNRSLKGLEAERAKLTPHVDKSIMSRYDMILKKWDGVAVVPVDGSACGGCFTNMPPQMINEIKLARDIIYCERCARILYCEG